MNRDENLWKEIYAALAWKLQSKDGTPQRRLNRLAREPFPELKVEIGEATCIARREQLRPTQVQELNCWHSRASPTQLGGAIIVFEESGKSAVIDGNNRVNAHLASGSDASMPAIIIKLR